MICPQSGNKHPRRNSVTELQIWKGPWESWLLGWFPFYSTKLILNTTVILAIVCFNTLRKFKLIVPIVFLEWSFSPPSPQSPLTYILEVILRWGEQGKKEKFRRCWFCQLLVKWITSMHNGSMTHNPTPTNLLFPFSELRLQDKHFKKAKLD